MTRRMLFWDYRRVSLGRLQMFFDFSVTLWRWPELKGGGDELQKMILLKTL
jgi:hypothetical protein